MFIGRHHIVAYAIIHSEVKCKDFSAKNKTYSYSGYKIQLKCPVTLSHDHVIIFSTFVSFVLQNETLLVQPKTLKDIML